MKTITDLICDSFVENGDGQKISQVRAFLVKNKYTGSWSTSRFYQIKRSIELMRQAIRAGEASTAKEYVTSRYSEAVYRDDVFQLVLEDEKAKPWFANFSAASDMEAITKVSEVVGDDNPKTIKYVLANLGFTQIPESLIRKKKKGVDQKLNRHVQPVEAVQLVEAVQPVEAAVVETVQIFDKYVQFVSLNKKHGREAVRAVNDLTKKHGQEVVREIADFLQGTSLDDLDRIRQIWEQSLEVFDSK